MQYASQAQGQDCVTEIRKICKATSNSYGINDITRRFNAGLDRYFHLAFTSDARWTFDDANQTSEALETINLVSGTNKYQLSTLTSELLQVFRIEFLDSAGNGILGVPEDLQSLPTSFTELYKTTVQGIPNRYIKFGGFLYVRDTPSYNKTGGIKFFFDRPASRMLYNDTTKVPGVPTIHHMYLCKYAAYPYVRDNNPKDAARLKAEILEDEEAITEYFAQRADDAGPAIIRPKYRSPR